MDDSEIQETMGVRFQRVPHATDEAEVRARHESNRRGWNEGAEAYRARADTAIEFLKGGGSNLHPIERANLARLGPLREWCRTAIHLQCASGEGTLSLWNEGAAHIENARRLSEALGAPAVWHRCDLLDAPKELNGTADLVYTGRGALCWILDLRGWASVVARLLTPGGVVHVLDDHPSSALFDPGADALVPSGLHYFEHSEWSQGWPDSYIGTMGRPLEEHARKYERLWPLASVIQALLDQGLALEFLGEHAEGYRNNFNRLPPEIAARIPRTFSLLARRPAKRRRPEMETALRPAADEYAPYYGRYVNLVPDGPIVETLRNQIAETMAILSAVPEAKGDHRYEPDKWSIKEVMGHVIDGERIFSYRALRFARRDETPLPGFEQNLYVPAASFGRRTLRSLLDEFGTVREATVHLFRHLDEEALSRSGVASENRMSVRALAWVIAGHERHHLGVLRERYL